MTTQFELFKKTLYKMFMLEQADLDFGIYRIMKEKRKDIDIYLNNILPEQVKNLLAENTSTHTQELKKQLEEAIR